MCPLLPACHCFRPLGWTKLGNICTYVHTYTFVGFSTLGHMLQNQEFITNTSNSNTRGSFYFYPFISLYIHSLAVRSLCLASAEACLHYFYLYFTHSCPCPNPKGHPASCVLGPLPSASCPWLPGCSPMHLSSFVIHLQPLCSSVSVAP